MTSGKEAASVRDQYEAYPYPPRDPADEATRLITGSPSDIVEIEHYVFGRKLTEDRVYRILVAGGGTGDAMIMLASQLAARGIVAEIIYLDLSSASLDIARARAVARRLENIIFIQGSLCELPKRDLGKFDYIDCCGVLHHLPDPLAGLQILAAALQPEGGIGLMVYGRLGRTGVYEAQDLLRLMVGDLPDPERVKTAHALLEDLPPTNWLLHNSHIGDHRNAGDAGIYDLLLHRQDRAYSVPDLFTLAAAAGLRITGFVEPARYDPCNYLQDAALRKKVAALPWPEQCAAAELICGNLKVHICYLVPAGTTREIPLTPESPIAVPMLKNVSGAVLAGRLQGAPALSLNFDGSTIRLTLPKMAAEITAQIYGERSVAEIRKGLGKGGHRLSKSAFLRQFNDLYKALNGMNMMFLR